MDLSIVVKPTLSCNIGCRHCYHADERTDGVISEGTLEKVIRLASSGYETVRFIWHGGEPLTLPLKFYKKAISLQERYFGKDSHRVSNTVQTNGTLIDKRFMNFCREKKINVGVSFEGPCNDMMRKMTETVQKNLDMMKKEGHMFSVSSTVCRNAVTKMEMMYDHFVGNGMALSLSPVIRLGSATPDTVPDADEYADASIRTFNKWLYDVNAETPLMPHLLYVASALGEQSPSDCAHSSCAMKWMCVYPNGDIYPCAKGCPSRFRLCNIDDVERLSDAFRKDAMGEFLTQTIERRERCMAECELFRYCNGGCSVDALSEGSMSSNGGNSCKIFKKVFSHILNTTETILRDRPDLSRYNKFVREAIIGKLVDPKVTNV